MTEYKEKVISLNKNQKLVNACKKAGIDVFNPQGEFNGYGYTKLPAHARITSVAEMRKFNKIRSEITGEVKPELTEEEKIDKWCDRLVKLTGITFDEAKKIALEKLDYKQDRINLLLSRDDKSISKQRNKLISKVERENPLRYIKDKEHANAVLAASYRHNNTNYESALDEGRGFEWKGFSAFYS